MGKEGCSKLEGWKREFQAFVGSLLRLSGEFYIGGRNWVEKNVHEHSLTRQKKLGDCLGKCVYM